MSVVKPDSTQPSNVNSQQQRTSSYDARVQTDVRCTVERAAEVISGKWTTLILRDLLSGTKRFGELRHSLTGISPKTLTDRLRDLEEQDILTRTIYPEVPPRVEYTLTDKGRALGAVIQAMAQWGERWT
ncbi:MAG: helix-turn-helix domain-containing protein [Deinococcota bacterium]